jgi:hypothetical protein
MFGKLACAALVGALLAYGCGGSTGNAEGSAGSGGSGAGTGGDSASGGSTPLAAGCYLAIRIDECCNAPIPASADEIDFEPCLVTYPIGEIGEALRAQCTLPDYCALVDCAMGLPTSRLVEADASGQCVFVDECATEADCAVATDHRYCCQCPGVFPSALVESETCIGTDYPGLEAGCADCSAVSCAGCATVDLIPTCSEPVDGYRLCQ